MSFFSRISQEATNSFQDAYSSLVLGDDAGKSARIVLVIRPNPPSSSSSHRHHHRGIDLGMTFLEINGRAYVRTVQLNSHAAHAGVLPRDAVQFAAVFKQEWMQQQQQQQQPQDQDDHICDADATAAAYALDCEAKGLRVTYEELRRILKEGLDHSHSPFLSPPPRTSTASSKWKGPPIPSTINVCAPDGSDYVRPLSPFRGETPRPVVFVLRRTRQRPTSGLLSFRLDDECDLASSLVRRLAPTADMEIPTPDVWEEMVHDGTDWLLGTGSILPPKRASPDVTKMSPPEEAGIPFDDYERQRAIKLAKLRSRMAAEAMQSDRVDDVEAATIRAMIQKAVGLAFVKASKVVLGVSLHGGSGIVIARLSDGTWSAPSAIGTWGLGFGFQFGLEVAEYIFILQTQESLDHFRKGGSFTIGGNVGAAVAGMGREAYGAASVGASCTSDTTIRPKEDEYNDEDDEVAGKRQNSLGIAPIVAYAKSQGLYVGVSLEGSRIFARDDINARAYKFSSGREVNSNDILTGKVPTPPEAEDLYAALHSVEFTHEMSCLPRPPEILREDSPNSWFYDQSTLRGSNATSSKYKYSFLSDLSPEESDECEAFETQFKKFMYGGVSVQRLIPDSESRSTKTRKERRTLWLMLPEVGALRLGFVSKLSDGDGPVSNKSSTQRAARDQASVSIMEGDLGTVASEELTLDSALLEKDGSKGHIRTGNVQLSNKHSVALTDVTLLSQETDEPVRFSSDDQTEHLRVICIRDVSGTSLLFLANNFREAELLYCGLKLLLERETARLGVRGGLPLSTLGGKVGDGAMSPTAARGFKESTPVVTFADSKPKRPKARREAPGYSSSEIDNDRESWGEESETLSRYAVPEGRQKWGNVPGRDYMRVQAAQAAPRAHSSNGVDASNQVKGIPRYVHGQLLVRDIAKSIQLPLPLPLCRVLLLDSSSPVIFKWEKDRGDLNFSRTNWTFPPATPRELEQHDSEHQLIASGSMLGAHRTTSFDRPRNGALVPLSETQIIDADDSEKLAFTVSERMPRRGFSVKVRILLRATKANSCEATVLAEVRPVGKNMSNQAAVQRAFELVLEEIKARYGSEGKGLMAGFLNVVENLPSPARNHLKAKDGSTSRTFRHAVDNNVNRPFSRTDPAHSKRDKKGRNGQKGNESGLVSFEDIMKSQNDIPEPSSGRRRTVERPSTPSMNVPPDVDPGLPKKRPERKFKTNDFVDMPQDEQADFEKSRKPMTIEVKPLPKIRLSLMPSPREEDEEDESSGPAAPVPVKKKKPRRRNGSSDRHSGRYR